MVKGSYRAILFDSGGTLLHSPVTRRELVWRFAAANGLSSANCDAAYERGEAHFLGNYLQCRTRTAARRVSDEASLIIGGALTDDPHIALSMIRWMRAKPMMQPYPEVPGILNSLSLAGYDLGIVSNHPWGLRDTYVHLGLESLFRAIVVSGEEGVEKPDRRIYEIALKALGREPDEVLFVGDNPEHDYDAPLSLGMGAVLINRHRTEGEDLRDLAGLAGFLGLRVSS